MTVTSDANTRQAKITRPMLLRQQPGKKGDLPRGGVTLIELLCVIAIIVLLAGLLLGPIARVMGRARAMHWGETVDRQISAVGERLKSFLAGRDDYPAVTLPGLEAAAVFNQEQLAFLHDRCVAFFPFQPSSPNDAVVVAARVESGFLTTGGNRTLTKGMITPSK